MASSSNDKISTGIVMIGGVLVITVLAGLNDRLGKLLVIFVLGILLLWAMSNTPLLSKWTSKLHSASNTGITPQ